MNFAWRSLSVLFWGGGYRDAYGLRIAKPQPAASNNDSGSVPINELQFSNNLPSQSDIQFIAIDCGILYGPPNTLLAARRALKDGAHALNIDLILTKDLKLVGMHSPSHYLPYTDFPHTLEKLTNQRFDTLPKTPSCASFRNYLASKGVSMSHLNGLMDCEPQAMNTVEDFLTAFPNTPMHFDMKADTLALQFQQKQILEDILHSKFPERAKITDGSFTSIRFFHKPEELIQYPKMQKQFSRNGPSIPVFLGDPAGDEEYLSMLGMADYDKDVADQTILNIIEKGPEFAPPGVLGAYIPSSTIKNFGVQVPQAWQGKFEVICDMPNMHEQMSAEACAPSQKVHTHFFNSVHNESALNSERILSADSRSLAFTVRGLQQEGEDIPRSTFTRCAGKFITAMLVLLLQEQRILPGLDEPIVEHLSLRHLKDWQDHPVLQKLTLRQVMSGTGGLISELSDKRWLTSQYKSTEFISTQALQMIPESFPVGKKFIYSNAAWTLVERAIEQATGLGFPLVARKYLFDPIGISEKTFYMEQGGPSCPLFRGDTIEQVNLKAGIGLCTITDDWELFAQTLVAWGKSPKTNNQVISETSIRELYVDQLATHFTETLPEAKKVYPLGSISRYFLESDSGRPYDKSNPSLSRGLGSYIIPETNTVMAWGGTLGSHLHPNRERDAAIMIKPGMPTYLSRLTFEVRRNQTLDKRCITKVFGVTTDSYTMSCE